MSAPSAADGPSASFSQITETGAIAEATFAGFLAAARNGRGMLFHITEVA